MNGTEHVVVGEEVIKAQVLDRSPDLANRGRISSKLVLRIGDADLYGSQPATGWTALLAEVVRTELPLCTRTRAGVDGGSAHAGRRTGDLCQIAVRPPSAATIAPVT